MSTGYANRLSRKEHSFEINDELMTHLWMVGEPAKSGAVLRSRVLSVVVLQGEVSSISTHCLGRWEQSLRKQNVTFYKTVD